MTTAIPIGPDLALWIGYRVRTPKLNGFNQDKFQNVSAERLGTLHQLRAQAGDVDGETRQEPLEQADDVEHLAG